MNSVAMVLCNGNNKNASVYCEMETEEQADQKKK